MGAETRFFSFDRIPEKVMMERWNSLVQEDGYNRGHESYQGSLTEIRYLDTDPKTYVSFKLASAKAREEDVDKRHAVIYKVGNPDQFNIMLDKKGKALTDGVSDARLKESAFFGSLLHRVFQQKSATKGCKACGCSFSKKAMASKWSGFPNLPATVSDETLHTRFMDLLRRNLDEYEYQRVKDRPADSAVFNCFMCGSRDFVITPTDKKRLESLVDKTKKAREALNLYQPVLNEKWSKVKGDHGWVIVACVPT